MSDLVFYGNIAQFFMMACSGVSAFVGFINRMKFKNIGYFYLYPLASLIQMSIFYWSVFSDLDNKTSSAVTYSSANIFLLVEFIMIYYFFLTVLKTGMIKTILYMIAILYFALICYYWCIKKDFYSYPKNLFIWQAFFIIIPTIVYFLELFRTPISIKLSKHHNFWIASGVMLYFGCTFPLFLMMTFVTNTNYILLSYVYFINYIGYSLFFLFIARAYLCPKVYTS